MIPNYQNNGMNGYQMPQYQQNYSPYPDRSGQYQPYQQNLFPSQIPGTNQLQPQVQPQIQPQVTGLVGRAVNDFSEIRADDVPANGTPAIFVKNDMSEIEVRIWHDDGLIRPTLFRPVEKENNAEDGNVSQMNFNAIYEDIKSLKDDIMSKLDSIEKSVTAPAVKTTRGKKMEVTTSE